LTADQDLIECVKDFCEADVRVVPVLANHKVVGMVDAKILLAGLVNNGYKQACKKLDNLKKRTLEYDTSIEYLWQKLEQDPCYYGYAIVKKKRLIGVVTRSNLLGVGMAKFSRESERHHKSTGKVEKIMQTPAIYATSDETTEAMARRMVKHNIGILPILENGEVKGVVSAKEMLRLYVGV
jgi:predicted transcriptional regulator